MNSTIERRLPNTVDDISDQDVVCGRGGASNSHKGNIFFRSLVSNNKPKYLIASKVEKKLIAKSIIATVRRRGGRFLKWSSDQRDGFIDMGDVAAMDKTCQALREGLKVRALTKEKKAKQSSLPSKESPSSNDDDERKVFNGNVYHASVSVHQSDHLSSYMHNSNGTHFTSHDYSYRPTANTFITNYESPSSNDDDERKVFKGNVYHASVSVHQPYHLSSYMHNSNGTHLIRHDYSYRPTTNTFITNYRGVNPNGQQYAEAQPEISASNRSINKDLEDKKSVQLLARCTCKKSYCLKLYCQCFSNSMYCVSDHCRCTNCYNSLFYNEIVHEAIERIATRKGSAVKLNTEEATT